MAAEIKTPDQNPQGMRSPSEQGLPYQEVWLQTSDAVRLHAWFIPSPNDSRQAPTLLFAHENAGNMGLRLQEFRYVHAHLACNLLLYDYRGYGCSDSALINEDGLLQDARAAWTWLVQQPVDTSRIILYGRSLGGAVTAQLASQLCKDAANPLPAGVILGNTFLSIEDLLGSLVSATTAEPTPPASP